MRFAHVLTALALAGALAAEGVQAQNQVDPDKAAYEQSSIKRYLAMFAAQDVNKSDRVTREEVRGNIDFTAVFDDIDINRDGIVTRAELDRYLAQRFGYARS